MPEALIIDAVRSPRAKGKPDGGLHSIHPQRCLGQVMNALQERVGFDVGEVDDVIMGNANGVGDHASDIARMAALDAGWPIEVPGVTLNRFCGSGQQAVSFAAMGIASGHQHAVVAGGVEFMSRWAPLHIDGFQANNPHLFERYSMVPQGVSGDLIATIEGFSRQDCDAYGARSQDLAAAAKAAGSFNKAIVPIRNDEGEVAITEDELPRPGTTVEQLAGLKPSFEAMGAVVPPGYEKSFDEYCSKAYPHVTEVDHVHHAGNSSGVSDGASALLLASSEYANANGLKPRAKIVMSAVAGSEPVIMLTGPGPAAQKCLARAGMTVDDIDIWEVNEAFASVVLKFQRDLNVDMDKVNVDGGAIALGHPIGATGGILIQTALDILERENKSTAMIAMCTGGGMGTATIIERI